MKISPKDLFQTALRRNFYFAKAYHQLKSLSLIYSFHGQPVIVHQMGKVASTAIYESLREMNLDSYSIYHTHYLSDLGFQKSKRFYKENYHRIKAIHTALVHSFFFRSYLKSNARKKFKIITLVRDPVAKNVSSFFQNLNYSFDFPLERYRETHSLEDITEKLRVLFIEEFTGHEVPLTWFDLELKSVFDIDVFEIPFDFEKGYYTYAGTHADVLLLKLESLNDIVETAVKDFLELKSFKLNAKNIGDDKGYAEIYRFFRKNIRLPESYLDRMYSSKYARHFYSPEEIEGFRRKW